jgi:hypothetical protein
MTSAIVSEAEGIIAALICPRLQHVKLLSSDLGGDALSLDLPRPSRPDCTALEMVKAT